MDYAFGIDISKYNHSSDESKLIDFDLMNRVCKFVAFRAGISWGYIDPKFHDSWPNFNGPRLAYHVVYPGENGIDQADHFLNIVKPTDNDRLVLDLELSHGFTKGKITDTAITILEYIRNITGRYPIVYSRATWVNSYLDVSRLPKVDWWLANYLTRKPDPEYTPERNPPPTLPIGVNNWLIHQTAEHGNGSAVGVSSHYVDCNRWNGTDKDVLSYFGLGENTIPIDPPVDIPKEKLFDARVYSWATPYVNIRKEPDINSNDIGDIYPNVTVPVYKDTGSWYEIEYKSKNGFVMKKFLEKLGESSEHILIDIPPLWQKDPRWKDKKLGNSYLTIGSHGCLNTCLSMIAKVNPDVFNDRLKSVGGFVGANIYWKMVSVAYPYVEYLRAIDCYFDPVPLDEIDNYLRQKITVLVHIDGNPATPQIDQHWIQIVGKDGDDYIANDPLTGMRISFKKVYGDPARWIFRIRVYKNNRGD